MKKYEIISKMWVILTYILSLKRLKPVLILNLGTKLQKREKENKNL